MYLRCVTLSVKLEFVFEMFALHVKAAQRPAARTYA